MHLFIVDGKKEQGGRYTIDDAGCIHQITRVLRMHPGDNIMIQQQGVPVRYTVSIESITSSGIITSIISESQGPKRDHHVTIVVAMPNKFEKAELIVQKLTEVGVDEIIFRPARRSIIRDFPEKKLLRCAIIAQEATEQSRGRKIPTIMRSKDFLRGEEYDEHFLVDYHPQSKHPVLIVGKQVGAIGKKCIAYIGPEGGFHDDEYIFFSGFPMKQLVLGEQVLRMETAAITAGWRLIVAKR